MGSEVFTMRDQPSVSTYERSLQMNEIIDILLYKLSSKGVAPMNIPRFVKDVLNIVRDGGEFTINTINRRMETLGWDNALVDQFTFELIIALLENEGLYEVRVTTIH
jgi:hypothetical protein